VLEHFALHIDLVTFGVQVQNVYEKHFEKANLALTCRDVSSVHRTWCIRHGGSGLYVHKFQPSTEASGVHWTCARAASRAREIQKSSLDVYGVAPNATPDRDHREHVL